MIHCQNCGQANAEKSNFCRYCGVKFGQTSPLKRRQSEIGQPPRPQRQPERPAGQQQPHQPPRPYSWKTDEFEVRTANARQTSQIDNMAMAEVGANRQMTRPFADTHNQETLTHGYRCPRCASQALPYRERKISSAGWIVFAVLLVFFFPLFWVGFLMKEDVLVCPVCDFRVN